MLEDDFSELETLRLEKINRLREQGIEPYPTTTFITHTTAEAVAAFEAVEADADAAPTAVVLAGRLRAIRNMGILSFAHIEDRSG